MARWLLIAALVATPAAAQVRDGTGGKTPQRIRNVYLLPGEKCPTAATDEIVVCAPADKDQYRIPQQFRDAPSTDAANIAWGAKVDGVMADNRKVLPGSCSAVGTNGQTGCAQQAAEQWAAEKRARANGQPVEPQ